MTLPDVKETSLTATYYRLTHVDASHPLEVSGKGYRFNHDDEENPTSYLGDSKPTVLKEVEGRLLARLGFSARIRPDQYRLVTTQVRLNRIWDLRTPQAQAALGTIAGLVTGEEHHEELKRLGREARRAGIQGFLWQSSRHPGGVCLVVFLENVPEEDLTIIEDKTLGERPE